MPPVGKTRRSDCARAWVGPVPGGRHHKQKRSRRSRERSISAPRRRAAVLRTARAPGRRATRHGPHLLRRVHARPAVASAARSARQLHVAGERLLPVGRLILGAGPAPGREQDLLAVPDGRARRQLIGALRHHVDTVTAYGQDQGVVIRIPGQIVDSRGPPCYRPRVLLRGPVGFAAGGQEGFPCDAPLMYAMYHWHYCVP
jgi:hypothetical protein